MRRMITLLVMAVGAVLTAIGYYLSTISGLSFLHPSIGYPCGAACGFATYDTVRSEFWGGTGLLFAGLGLLVAGSVSMFRKRRQASKLMKLAGN